MIALGTAAMWLAVMAAARSGDGATWRAPIVALVLIVVATTVAFAKACECRGATATTGALRVEREVAPRPDVSLLMAWIIEGPSCDECGTPWRRVQPIGEAEGVTGVGSWPIGDRIAGRPVPKDGTP